MEPIPVEVLRHMAAVAGYAWPDEDLEALTPQVTRLLALLTRLASARLGDLEPTARFHME
jgi:hypothetical protein